MKPTITVKEIANDPRQYVVAIGQPTWCGSAIQSCFTLRIKDQVRAHSIANQLAVLLQHTSVSDSRLPIAANFNTEMRMGQQTTIAMIVRRRSIISHPRML